MRIPRTLPTTCMKKIILLLLWCAVVVPLRAQQTASLQGSVQDTVDFKSVSYANVIAIRASDSVMLAFTRIKGKGSFVLNNLPAGRLRLLITHPGFADYEDFVTVKEGDTVQLGAINLISKANLLKEVLIKDKIEAIRIKGDTTEFLVDSFLTNKNANVEDLMRRLPGIQVDKDGKITAQGKEVKKVLVDGEEFFGDDPTIATRNIKATQVESVQVFDKKSEQATISGVDDGITEKTINLKLKEDAKKGYFGKVGLAGGSNERYENEAMFNRFNRKQKVSAYAAMSNTNKTGLSWEDNQKFGGDNSNFFTDDDGNSYMYYYDNDGFDGVGIPQTWYVGAHYGDKKKSDKHAYSFNVSHKEMEVRGFNDDYTKYILPDTFYFNKQRDEINNSRKGNNFSGKYEVALDSLTTLKVNLSVAQSEHVKRNTFLAENRNQEQQLVNSNNRKTTEDGTNQSIESSINLIKKFHTQGRSLSFGVTQEYRDLDANGFLNAEIRLYEPDSSYQSTLLDQKKLNQTTSQKYSVNLTYTEPFGKKYALISDYALNTSEDKSARYTMIKSGTAEYTQQLDSLSNDFRYGIMAHRGGLSLRYKYAKITFSVGGRVSYTDLRQNNLVQNNLRTQSFVNYFPSARFNYKIGTTSTFEISYNGRTRQPSLQQIQPLIDNTNPLNLYTGNTSLVQSFSNSYGLSYNNYKPLTGSGIWSNLSFSHAYNDFASNSTVSTDGRTVYQTVNVDGNYQLSANLYHYFSLKKLGVSFNNNLRSNVSRVKNFINGLENENFNQTHTLGFYASKEEDEKYYFSLSGEWSYNRSTTSIRSDVVTQYWLYEYGAEVVYYLPAKIIFEGEANYYIRQKTSAFDQDLNTTIINLELKRKFTKKENLEIGFGVKDLLNQNIGFRRTATSNFVNENTHTILRRYFMLSLTYQFNSAGNKKEDENE